MLRRPSKRRNVSALAVTVCIALIAGCGSNSQGAANDGGAGDVVSDVVSGDLGTGSESGMGDGSSGEAGPSGAGVDAAHEGSAFGDSGAPTLIVTNQSWPTRLELAASTLVWIDFGANPSTGMSMAGQVDTCGVGGCGNSPKNLAMAQNSPEDVAADSTTVYWTTPTAVLSSPIGGGTPTTVASGQSSAFGIAMDATNLYWTTADAVLSIPRSGGIITTIASGQAGPAHVAVDATNVFWTVTGTAQNNYQDGAVSRCAIGGCNNTPNVLAPNRTRPSDVAVDGSNVYWAEINGIVASMPKGGGAISTLSSAGSALGLAVDSSSVFWADYGNHAVMSVPIAGGTPATSMPAARPSMSPLTRRAFTGRISRSAVARYLALQSNLGGGFAPTRDRFTYRRLVLDGGSAPGAFGGCRRTAGCPERTDPRVVRLADAHVRRRVRPVGGRRFRRGP